MEARQPEQSELDTVIEIDAKGRLQGDEAVLAQLLGQKFRLRGQGGTLTMRAQSRRISEITDLQERRQALDAPLEWVAIADVPPPPERHNLREDISD